MKLSVNSTHLLKNIKLQINKQFNLLIFQLKLEIILSLLFSNILEQAEERPY